MNRPKGARQARRLAQEIFQSPLVPDALARAQGKLSQAIPVQGPGGDLAGWFFGITVGEQIAGFIQLDDQLTFLRYSSFQRRRGAMEGCPKSEAWLDPEYISRRAAEKCAPGDQLSPPVLTYDTTPSRLAWAVPVLTKRGHTKTVFVAGDYVYVAKPPQSHEPTTG
jgi:hypothetical protein